MDNRTYLSLPAAAALKALLVEEIAAGEGQTVLDRWIDLSVDGLNSTVTAASRAISTDGLVGQYTGTVSFPYVKRSLDALLPYPFVLPLAYPTTFVMLATYLQAHYGIVLEDGEVTVVGNSVPTALGSTDPVDALPDVATGYVTVMAAPASGRFVAGSRLQLLLTSPTVQVPLRTVLAMDSPLALRILTDH